jgi:hypothetical protein
MTRQRGVALMAMLAVLILGATWWTVGALGKPANRTAEQRAQNAQVLQQAKAALIGWVAHQAAMTGENDPGRLPCPEATTTPGIAAPTCALPAVARLPWRTLGLDQLRDAAGEPLWYVVSPGWTLDGVVANTVLNSNSTGALTLDATGDVVALIIAPGTPLSVAASADCQARNQVRPSIDPRDYFECQNAVAGAALYASSGPAGSFNDQVLAVTAAELLPAIEAAVADRFRRNIAPLIRSVYSNVDGTNASWPNAPLLPFAAQFADPAASTFKGAAAHNQGLLPLTYSTNPADGTPCDTADARCDPNFVAWQASTPAVIVTNGTLVAATCSSTSTLVTCNFRASYPIVAPNITVTITHRANNVGLALRQFNPAVATGMNAAGRTASGATFLANGSADLSVSGTMPVPAGTNLLDDTLCSLVAPAAQLANDCGDYTVTVPIGLMADHPLIQDSAATNPQHWFLRNRWHQVAYYAVAPEIAPGGAGVCAGCLTVNFGNPAAAQRGLIVLSGRSLNGAARPNGTLTDWLEGANCDLAGPNCAPDTTFATRAPTLAVNRTFNDRVVVIDP